MSVITSLSKTIFDNTYRNLNEYFIAQQNNVGADNDIDFYFMKKYMPAVAALMRETEESPTPEQTAALYTKLALTDYNNNKNIRNEIPDAKVLELLDKGLSKLKDAADLNTQLGLYIDQLELGKTPGSGKEIK